MGKNAAKKQEAETPVMAKTSAFSNIPPTAPKRSPFATFFKIFLSILLITVSCLVIYLAIEAGMLAWVILGYLIMVLLFFPALILLLI